jgi:IS1 family transposase
LPILNSSSVIPRSLSGSGLARAGEHAEKVHAHFFHHQTLGHLQLDELLTTLRDKAHDLWVWTAHDPVTKLIPALQVGPRTQAMAYAVIHALTLALAPGCLPIFTSDGLNLYFYALTAHFGQWISNSASGKHQWRVALDLPHGQVKKTYRRRKLHFVERLMRLGDLPPLSERLKALGLSGTLNTAFVERLNLTLRHALAALPKAPLLGHRPTHGQTRGPSRGVAGRLPFLPPTPLPAAHTGLAASTARRSTPRRFASRTPPMAAGLTNHIWSVQELLAFPVG